MSSIRPTRKPGDKFGKLTLVRRDHQTQKRGKWRWLCQCDCGGTKIALLEHVTSGRTSSCGCIPRGNPQNMRPGCNRTHGETNSITYGSWCAMMSRCRNPNFDSYKYYGAKGILVCERWEKFENFLADMGVRPSKKHSLDRIDNNGNYEPGNCRWATQVEQINNSSIVRFVLVDGEMMNYRQASLAVGRHQAWVSAQFSRITADYFEYDGRKLQKTS